MILLPIMYTLNFVFAAGTLGGMKVFNWLPPPSLNFFSCTETRILQLIFSMVSQMIDNKWCGIRTGYRHGIGVSHKTSFQEVFQIFFHFVYFKGIGFFSRCLFYQFAFKKTCLLSLTFKEINVHLHCALNINYSAKDVLTF